MIRNIPRTANSVSESQDGGKDVKSLIPTNPLVKSTPPSIFQLVKRLDRHKIPGTTFLLSMCRRFWADQVIVYPMCSSFSLAVPIGTKERCWDLRDLLEYESHLVAAFLFVLGSFSDVTLFDCGADIGLFSSVVCARSNRITRVLAFEPNPKIQDIFRRNISVLPNGEAHAVAVADFQGFGRLESPDYANGDHARFLVPADSGIPVVTVDSFRVIGGDVAIKIDVEGGELDVLRGCECTIRHASHCVLTLEVHPRVYSRTGVSPAACMTFLESIRPFRFFVTETGRWVNAKDDIIDSARVLNVLAVTP